MKKLLYLLLFIPLLGWSQGETVISSTAAQVTAAINADTIAKLATKYDITEKTETVSRTIYVATTGSDVTGTGAVGAPFLTLLKAVQNIKPTINENVVITIQMSAGTYTFLWAPVMAQLPRFNIYDGGSITIQGNVVQNGGTFTLAAGSPADYVYTVTGRTFTANEPEKNDNRACW